MGFAERDDPRFDVGSDLVGAPVGTRAAVGERTEAFVRVTDEPAMDGPPIDAVSCGDVGDLGAVEHLSHREETLLNHRQLREHLQILLGSGGPK